MKEKLTLVLCFLAISISISYAHLNPPTNYEISIYYGAPVFSVVLLTTLAIGCITAIYFSKPYDVIGLLVVFLSSFSIAGAHLIRGYYYYGSADALSHLGRIKSIHSGSYLLSELRYITLHSLSLFLYEFNNSFEQSIMMAAIIFALLYVASIIIIGRKFVTSRLGMISTVIFGCMLMPIDAFAIRVTPHPFSQAMLFLPIVLFSHIYHLRARSTRSLFIFTFFVLSSILIHPFIIFIISPIIVVSELIRFVVFKQSRISFQNISVVIIAVGFWYLRMAEHYIFSNIVRVLSINIIDVYRSGLFEGEATARAGSVSEAGSSLVSTIAKIYSPSIIGMLLVTFLIISIALKAKNTLNDVSADNAYLSSLYVGFIAFSFIPILLFIGQIGSFVYRMVSVFGILAAIGGPIAIDRSSNLFSNRSRKLFISILLVSMLIVAAGGFHASPEILRPNEQVQNAHMQGFESAFEYEGEHEYNEVRTREFRFRYGIEGAPLQPWMDRKSAPDHFADQGLPNYYDDDHYLIITSRDIILDVHLYNEIRYTKEDFQYLDTDSNIQRVHNNGEFELYLINAL